MESRSVFLADAAATADLGRQLAETWLRLPADRRPLLLLEGDLGAGKTCLVQGIAGALGIEEAITSPTFALAQHYRGRRDGTVTALVHLDLYRLELPAAADELFAQEEEEARALGALLAVEWAGRLSNPPTGALQVSLTLAEPGDPAAGRLARVDLNADDGGDPAAHNRG
ncbi:MAG: tRNA ((37)-N6)-threonylcarbamoyltransferase complex ATPase subunit type 1 TsaE [Cyanobacteriota bacterium]